MTLDDRLTRGFLAGVLAGAAQSVITIPAYALKLTKLRWLDFASVILFGSRPNRLSQAIVGEIAALGWTGLLGIGYTYAMPRLGERNSSFKGALYGATSWAAIYTAVHLLRISKLDDVDRTTTMVHGGVAIGWGVFLNEVLHGMEQKTEVASTHDSTSAKIRQATSSLQPEEGSLYNRIHGIS